MRSKNAGMTLMELLIVMVIVGILAAIAIPSYRKHVQRANRADAKAALLSMAGQLERCFTRFNSYAEDDGCEVESGATSTEGKYRIDITDQSAVGYALSAVPLDGQEDDVECATFTLDSSNVKGTTGDGDSQRCWSK